jgi:hypothetical protein
MIALRLVHLIETHGDELAEGLLEKIQRSERTGDIRKVPAHELRDRTREIYRNLSDWLMNKTESEIERVYKPIGARRAQQGVSLTGLAWALLLTKEHLWDFLEQQGIHGNAEQLFGELELLRHLDRFFDRAVFFAVEGYEQAGKTRKSPAAA